MIGRDTGERNHGRQHRKSPFTVACRIESHTRSKRRSSRGRPKKIEMTEMESTMARKGHKQYNVLSLTDFIGIIDELFRTLFNLVITNHHKNVMLSQNHVWTGRNGDIHISS